MAIWTIPDEYKIDYSRNGDDVDAFSQKVKYCLEEAFVGLNELHETTKDMNSSITTLKASMASLKTAMATIGTPTVAGTSDASSISGIAVGLDSLADGQILVYRESTKKFQNEAKPSVGESKSLTFFKGDELLGEYNGSSTLKIDLQPTITPSVDEKNLWHLTRLVENLYLVLDVAGLNPGGYDGLSSEAFYGTSNEIDTSRSTGVISEGELSGDGAIFVTKPIVFINEIAGTATQIKDAHLVVKHQNVADAEITAELALIDATFVKGEVLGIGTGLEQTVTLTHAEKLATYNFALNFDGVKQAGNYSFDVTNGEIVFVAPTNVIVTADYFYNWGEENFATMTKTGMYPDHKNHARATTQFTLESDTSGKIALLRLTLKQGEGYSANEIVTTGTGSPKGFKLQHQAIADTIQVTPSATVWTYNAEQNVIVINATSGQSVSVSYWWKGKSFSVDSFACVFNE